MNVQNALTLSPAGEQGGVSVQVCPSCSATEHLVLPGEGRSLKFERGGTYFFQPTYTIRECLRCGLLYKSAVLSTEALDRYYSVTEPTWWDIPGYAPLERETLRLLRTLPPRSRILDFGCSTGRLLSSLVSAHECFGIEPNANAARIAAEKGIRMLSEAQLATHRGYFDVVILADVVEHLLTPTRMLENLWRTVADLGRMFIATGNGDAPACRREPATFWYFLNPEHLCMLTRRYAEFLAQRLGAELTGWTEMCHYDLTLVEVFQQEMRDRAYWSFKRANLVSRALLRAVPFISRARAWPSPPTYSCSRDHVLAVFSRQPNGAEAAAGTGRFLC